MITRASGAWVVLAATLGVSPASLGGQDLGCLAPISPFLPSGPRDVRAYADLLHEDFEAYIRCLDAERARVLEEERAVVQDYGRLQQLTQTER